MTDISDGIIRILDPLTNKIKVQLVGNHPTTDHIRIGGDGRNGYVGLFPSSSTDFNLATASIKLNGNTGGISAGKKGIDGELFLYPSDAAGYNNSNFASIKMDGNTGNVSLGNKKDLIGNTFAGIYLEANNANVWLGSEEDIGGPGNAGDLIIFPSQCTDTRDKKQATFQFDGQSGTLRLGGKPKGQNATGIDGEILIYPDNVTDNQIVSEASIVMNGETGNIALKGDLKLDNADVAEEFSTSIIESIDAEPGTIMVIDNNDRLKISSKAYDRRVAGVISGAGEAKPGIVLGKKMSSKNNGSRYPIALIGKVYCKIDAKYSQVRVGDLLTTSPTPGHAMKATNRAKAFGAVIGKALGSLKSGKDLVPILVALQ